MADFEKVDAPAPTPARARTPVTQTEPPNAAGLIRLQRLAGNQAVSGVAQRLTGPPATQQEADDVVALMPVMGDIDTLVTATDLHCGAWNGWRSTMQGEVPGNGAFVAMTQFKAAVRAKGFDVWDERIQAVCRRRLGGDNRQLLTEMSSFSVGAGTSAGGDAPGLAMLFGIQTRPLKHRYTLKIAYGMGPKGKAGVGVGYTYRSATMSYRNDFGMGYDKPLNMRSFVASFGPEVGVSVASVDFSGEGTDESSIFWRPEEFETDFTIAKASANKATPAKLELKAIEVVRVTSDKHPPLLFDLMAGSAVAVDLGAELGATAGAGVELEKGWMVGGERVGPVAVTTPTLEQARKNAEEAKLLPPQAEAHDWLVIKLANVPFSTGRSRLSSEARGLVFEVSDAIEAWHLANPHGELRVEIVGHASPRWRAPGVQVADDLNQKLSEERATATQAALRSGLAVATGAVVIEAGGEPGPVIEPEPIVELDQDRTRTSGAGSAQAKAELADPDNNDAGYRVAVVTVWARKGPAPAQPAGEAP